jgi:hypothetical protein
MAKRPKVKNIKVNELSTSTLTVYRPNGGIVSLSSTVSTITFSVEAGVLLISQNQNLIIAFSSGQWLTVNVAPI